jgi:hypothetical protein
MTFLHALGNTTAHSTDSAAVQVTIIVVAACIVGIVGWVARRVLKKQADRERLLREKDDQRTTDMNEVKAALKEVKGALITDPPTPYNPFPQKKLVDRFNELWESHFQLKATVERMDHRSETIKEDTTVLRHESQTNQGGSMRAAVDQIGSELRDVQAEQGRVHAELDETRNQGD